jgi:hypothetical protein
MSGQFIEALSRNAAAVVTWGGAIGGVLVLILFLRARARRVRRLQGEIRREVPLTDRMKEALATVFNVQSAELTTVGAVTFADIALQYSMADPTIWDHFDGPAADHIADAIQNLDVLRASLGDQAGAFFHNVVDSLNNIEALSVFNDLAERLPLLESAGTGTAVAAEASGHSLVDSLAQAGSAGVEGKVSGVLSTAEAAQTVGDGGLLMHLPLVTIGFATYRAWRRSQKGTELPRNLEFASIEVATRAGGGLIGGQIGGVIGTAIVPGIGTIIGGVTGAIAGTVGGMFLGEDIKKRHVKKAREMFDATLVQLGDMYLKDPVRFKRLTSVFVENEREYTENLQAMRRRLNQHAIPFRVIWPDQKLVLLQETVHLAENRLSTIKQGTIDAVDRLNYMRETDQNHELGVILWSNAALRDQLAPDPELVQSLELTHERLRRELVQLQGQGAGA